MQKRFDATTITVPVPLHDPVRRGTAFEYRSAVGTAEIIVRDRIVAVVLRGLGSDAPALRRSARVPTWYVECVPSEMMGNSGDENPGVDQEFGARWPATMRSGREAP